MVAAMIVSWERTAGIQTWAEKRAQERELRQARERGPLQSLTDDQLRLDREAVSIPLERPGIWAWAWLRFGLDGHVRCKVRIARWTESAVGVELRLYGEVSLVREKASSSLPGQSSISTTTSSPRASWIVCSSSSVRSTTFT